MSRIDWTKVSIRRQRGSRRPFYRLAGCAAYLLGSFLATVVANVPRNEALATLEPASASAAAAWVAYVREWTTWNHVRAIAACAGLVLFLEAR